MTLTIFNALVQDIAVCLRYSWKVRVAESGECASKPYFRLLFSFFDSAACPLHVCTDERRCKLSHSTVYRFKLSFNNFFVLLPQHYNANLC